MIVNIYRYHICIVNIGVPVNICNLMDKWLSSMSTTLYCQLYDFMKKFTFFRTVSFYKDLDHPLRITLGCLSVTA